MEFSDVTSALIIASIIIWSRWFEVSLDRFIEFLTKSFEISSKNNFSHNIPMPNIDDKEIVNKFLNNIELYFASTYTSNVIYLLLFIGLIIFSSPIKSTRKLRRDHFKSYNYITSVIYLWIFVSILSHFPLLHDLMEIQLSLFPYFLFFTLFIVTIINITIKVIFQRLFVFHIGPSKRLYEVFHSSAFISILCSMLYGECEYYNYHNSDVCALLLLNIEYKYRMSPVLRIWFTGIAILIVNYVMEGIIVDRFIFSSFKHKHIEPQNTHEMVTWFSMSHHWVLLDLMMQLGIFVNRFDRRMLNVSIPQIKKKNINSLSSSEQSSSSCFTYLKDDKEVWFDFMADCGDGFNSSYEIARLLAQPYLLINDDDDLKQLPRGKVLLIGGDLAYAGPSIQNYEDKFFRVFEDALQPPDSFKKDSMICTKPVVPLSSYGGPTCLIIPGNHDWYDGLNAFDRLICNRSWLGGWLLPQSHTYFSLKLPYDWWVFAVDYGLNNDIDSSQFKYFSHVIDTYFTNDEKVIIISHEPGWIHQDHKGIKYGDNLKYLIEEVIGCDKLKLRLSGDLHNYTRHQVIDSATTAATLVVSGGGGAFLHPTHCPPKKPIRYHGNMYMRVKEYPSIAISKLYTIMNIFRFRQKNLSWDCMGGAIYYLVVFSCYPLCSLQDVDKTDYKELFTVAINESYVILNESYVSLAVLLCACLLCYLFTKRRNGSFKYRLFIALVHIFAHYIAALSIFIFAESLVVAIHELHRGLGDTTTFETFKVHFKVSYKWIDEFDIKYCGGYGIVLKCVEIVFNFIDIAGFHVALRDDMCTTNDRMLLSRLHRFVYHLTAFLFYFMLAAPLSAFILGIYLFISLNCLGQYDEGFSSLRLETYKNFCRFHLDHDGKLMCYVIGVDNVPNRWKLDAKWKLNDYLFPSKWISYYSKGKYNMSKTYHYRKVKIIDKFELI